MMQVKIITIRFTYYLRRKIVKLLSYIFHNGIAVLQIHREPEHIILSILILLKENQREYIIAKFSSQTKNPFALSNYSLHILRKLII